MLFYYLFIAILRYSGAISLGSLEHQRVLRGAGNFFPTTTNEPETCYTPDNQLGTCVFIRNCQSLLTLVNRSEEPIRVYLRKSLCGRDPRNGVPKVCCAKSIDPGNSGDILTPRIPVEEPVEQDPTTTPSSVNVKNDYSRCGRSSRLVTKITAGKNAELGDWPWMAALFYRSKTDFHDAQPKYRCGGTLVSKDWVITAAHCFDETSNLVSVRLGDLNLNDSSEGASPIDVPVREVILHPEYTTRPTTNDLALVRLRTPVTFTSLIRPICVLSGTQRFKSNGFYENKRPFITGWGRLSFQGELSPILQEAQIDIVDNERCTADYANFRAVIDHRVLCAGGDGKDSCRGDSGGPLIIPIGAVHYLAGVVSFGVGCANPDFPGVYTRVAEFTEWISRVTKLPI